MHISRRATFGIALTAIAASALTFGGLQAPAPAQAADAPWTELPHGDISWEGRTWHQTYAEGFDTPAGYGNVLRTYPQIGTYNSGYDTSGQGWYAPDKVLSVSNGNLDFWLRSENGQPLSAAILPDNYTPHNTAVVSMRYKTTTTTGYKFVGMLWPSDNNWSEGEIDWPEGDLGGRIRPASAVPWSLWGGVMSFLPAKEMFAPDTQSEYHVVTTVWNNGSVEFFQDGDLVASTTQAVPKNPMRLTLQAETFINEGWVPRDTSGHVDIDWISIWG